MGHEMNEKYGAKTKGHEMLKMMRELQGINKTRVPAWEGEREGETLGFALSAGLGSMVLGGWGQGGIIQ